MRTREQACEISDLGPEAYAAWRASEVGATTERLERDLILELIGDVNSLRILDVGCGDGDLAIALWQRGAKVVGIDVSNAMIEAGRARAMKHEANIEFSVASADHMPFPPEHFDVVVAVTILCFVEDAAPVFREIARVLRPGGRLIIGELGRWSTWAAERRIRAWLGSPLWRRGKFRTARELQSLAEQADLVAGPVRGAIYYPRWAPAMRLLAPFDAACSRLTSIGAAFVALSAEKPRGRAKSPGSR